jgi:hypothetical protein
MDWGYLFAVFALASFCIVASIYFKSARLKADAYRLEAFDALETYLSEVRETDDEFNYYFLENRPVWEPVTEDEFNRIVSESVQTKLSVHATNLLIGVSADKKNVYTVRSWRLNHSLLENTEPKGFISENRQADDTRVFLGELKGFSAK